MSVRDARTLEIAIDSTYESALGFSDEDRSRFAQLMTVWISGYLEVTCRDVLWTYAERESDEAVARFVGRRLRRIRSPNMDQILDLVGSFDKDREQQLREFVRGRIRASVNSVVNLRNEIAHGRSMDATIETVKAQFEDSRQLAGKLKELFAVAA